jgi:hypothetical protein
MQAARAAVQKAQEARKASDLAEKAARGAEEDALNAHTNTMRKVGGVCYVLQLELVYVLPALCLQL